MASLKNDQLRERTVEGSLNYYDEHRCIGTANDKAIAARLGGHSYNIISNGAKDEIYMRHLRHTDHYLDDKNKATNKWWGRLKKFPELKAEEAIRRPVERCLTLPEDHPKVKRKEALREQVQLAQAENPQNWALFQDRRLQLGYDDGTSGGGDVDTEAARHAGLVGRPSPRMAKRTLDTERVSLNAPLVREKGDFLARRHKPGASARGNGGASSSRDVPTISARSDRAGGGALNEAEVFYVNGGMTGRSVLSTSRSRVNHFTKYPDPEQILNESAQYATCQTANTAQFPYDPKNPTLETGSDPAQRSITAGVPSHPPISASARSANNATNLVSGNMSARSGGYSARSDTGRLWNSGTAAGLIASARNTRYKSEKRLPCYDFSVTRKNNDFSNCNKLTRNDGFYMRPRLAITNNSVKYNIITNGVRKFRHGD